VKPSLRHTLSRIFLNPFVVAIPFALITILLLPYSNSKHSYKLISGKLVDKAGLNTTQTYIDLDNDGFAEEISHFSNTINNCAVKITTQNGVLKGQWNFNGALQKDANLLVFDYDNNGEKEVFTIYNRADSVFLGGLNPDDDSKNLFDDIFLDKILFKNETIDFIAKMQAYDMDNDGFKDFVIALSAGHSKQPRRLLIWNRVKNTIAKSESIGVMIGQFCVVDIDRDGTPEIVPALISYENIDSDSDIPCNDWYRWLAVFDHELKPEFEPRNYGKGNGSIYPILFWRDEKPILVILDYNKKSGQKFQLHIFDWETKSLLPWDSEVKFVGDINIQSFYQDGEAKLLIIDNSGFFHVVNVGSLTVEQSIPVGSMVRNLSVLNVNNDSLPEILFTDEFNRLCILSNDLETVSHVQMPEAAGKLFISSRKLSHSERHLILQTGNQICEYQYVPRSFGWIVNWSLYLLVYLGYVLTIWLIMFGQERYLKRRYNREKLLAELKLKSIRNQMDPHFTFNAVNAIASAIFKEDKQSAYNYFSKFSKLVRSTMLYSDRMTRMLDDELDFTLKYLEIEKFRFREKFDFEIIVDDEVNLNMEVPRMIVQAYAESAINNGLMHKTKDGLLVIKVYNEDGYLIIELIDNGVGIEKSKELNKEKAFKAAKIMEEFIAVFNEFNNLKIICKMKDLMEDGKVSGSRVYIKIPFDISYTFSGRL